MQYAQPNPPHISTVTGLTKYSNTSRNTRLGIICSSVLASFGLNPESRTRNKCSKVIVRFPMSLYVMK